MPRRPTGLVSSESVSRLRMPHKVYPDYIREPLLVARLLDWIAHTETRRTRLSTMGWMNLRQLNSLLRVGVGTYTVAGCRMPMIPRERAQAREVPRHGRATVFEGSLQLGYLFNIPKFHRRRSNGAKSIKICRMKICKPRSRHSFDCCAALSIGQAGVVSKLRNDVYTSAASPGLFFGQFGGSTSQVPRDRDVR